MKKFLHFYIRFVQKILITILLTILYFVAFSITKLFLAIFPNNYFRRIKKTDTYWITAEGYSKDKSSALEQS